MATKKKKKVKRTPAKKVTKKKATKKVTKEAPAKKAPPKKVPATKQDPPNKGKTAGTSEFLFDISPKLDARFHALHQYLNDGKGTFADTAEVIMEAGIDSLEAGLLVSGDVNALSAALDADEKAQHVKETEAAEDADDDDDGFEEVEEDDGFELAYEERLRSIA